jgi:hypothetical protein
MKTRHIGLIAAAMAIALVAVALAPHGFNAHVPGLLGSGSPSDIMMLGVGMTTLAANKPRAFELGTIQEYPVIAADVIFEGAAVGENGAGYARPLVAGDPFLGFAETIVDNSAGVAGQRTVRVKRRGQVQIPVVGAAAITANDGPLVYASDDDTFTLTAGANSPIGRVSRWVESGVCVVDFDASLAAEAAARVAGDA